jgi:hypothetical protein
MADADEKEKAEKIAAAKKRVRQKLTRYIPAMPLTPTLMESCPY